MHDVIILRQRCEDCGAHAAMRTLDSDENVHYYCELHFNITVSIEDIQYLEEGEVS